MKFHFQAEMRNCMDENHQNKVGSKPITDEDKLWLPPLSPKDQKKVDRIRKKNRMKPGSNWRWGLSNKTWWDWLNLLGVLAIPFVVTVIGLYFTQQITQQQALSSDQ